MIRHINFTANETDMARIEVIRAQLKEAIGGGTISLTTVLRKALSIAVPVVTIPESKKPF